MICQLNFIRPIGWVFLLFSVSQMALADGNCPSASAGERAGHAAGALIRGLTLGLGGGPDDSSRFRSYKTIHLLLHNGRTTDLRVFETAPRYKDHSNGETVQLDCSGSNARWGQTIVCTLRHTSFRRFDKVRNDYAGEFKVQQDGRIVGCSTYTTEGPLPEEDIHLRPKMAIVVLPDGVQSEVEFLQHSNAYRTVITGEKLRLTCPAIEEAANNPRHLLFCEFIRGSEVLPDGVPLRLDGTVWEDAQSGVTAAVRFPGKPSLAGHLARSR